MVDIREKEEGGEILRRFIKRANQFNSVFGRGKGFAEYHTFAKNKELTAHATKVYATTRFVTSSFSQLKGIYDSYKALTKAFSATRESEDEEEEMKYMVKGCNFCLDLCGIIDILSKLMETMTKAQSLDQYLWSVTKWWPRVKGVLHAMKEDIEKHLVNDEVTIQKELFPKLKLHYEHLNKENAMECTFKNVDTGLDGR